MSAQSSLIDFDAQEEDDPNSTDAGDDLGASDIPAEDRPNWPSFEVSDNCSDSTSIPEPAFTIDDVADVGSPVSEDCPDWADYTADDDDAGIDGIWSVLQIWGDDYSEILTRDELGDADCTNEHPYGANRGDIR